MNGMQCLGLPADLGRRRQLCIVEKTQTVMETNAFDLIEEYQSEDIIAPAHRSLNHSKLIHRLSVA